MSSFLKLNTAEVIQHINPLALVVLLSLSSCHLKCILDALLPVLRVNDGPQRHHLHYCRAGLVIGGTLEVVLQVVEGLEPIIHDIPEC